LLLTQKVVVSADWRYRLCVEWTTKLFCISFSFLLNITKNGSLKLIKKELT